MGKTLEITAGIHGTISWLSVSSFFFFFPLPFPLSLSPYSCPLSVAGGFLSGVSERLCICEYRPGCEFSRCWSLLRVQDDRNGALRWDMLQTEPVESWSPRGFERNFPVRANHKSNEWDACWSVSSQVARHSDLSSPAVSAKDLKLLHTKWIP